MKNLYLLFTFITIICLMNCSPESDPPTPNTGGGVPNTGGTTTPGTLNITYEWYVCQDTTNNFGCNNVYNLWDQNNWTYYDSVAPANLKVVGFNCEIEVNSSNIYENLFRDTLVNNNVVINTTGQIPIKGQGYLKVSHSFVTSTSSVIWFKSSSSGYLECQTDNYGYSGSDGSGGYQNFVGESSNYIDMGNNTRLYRDTLIVTW